MDQEGADFRRWDELIPDTLGLIFRNLSLQEILTVVPRVCKSWGKVVNGPYCWQEIDIEEWSSWTEPGNTDRMLRMLVARSCGSLRKLCVYGLQNDLVFSFVLEHASSLRTLLLPGSNITDAIIEQVAGRLSTITFLDLSYCGKIGARSLEAIGKHCKALTGLRRNMHSRNADTTFSQEDEACTIAATMPKLKQLELSYLLINTGSVLEIVFSCHELQFLDLQGCWNVKLDEKYLREKFPNLKILGPQIVDHYEASSWEGCSDYSDSFYDTDSFNGMWDDEESLELRFYEGFGEDSGHGWPPSP
ncbi:similar to F-BOX WITH WD-40 2 [Actinidia rufa]|uniref:Similar to F-BOX WITH WD-40 2 n=1 Tax=Actinidia rufa TaxID=165716 RepID=A0A7J0FBQ1_9ERIC|nr:similar to F-BOX WITH WD-40 2 [Actinidia rufa]